MEYTYRLLITEILSRIPENQKPVHYIMNVLELSVESSYRRLRGEIPFTFSEIAKLSQNMGFSIDKIITENKPDYISISKSIDASTLRSDVFYETLKHFYNHLQYQHNARYMLSIMSWNRIPPIFLARTSKLFKFTFYKSIHQANEIPINKSFSDIELPEKIVSMQEKIKGYITKSNNNVFIIGPNLFFNLINEIKYYYQRKLITTDELSTLRQEMTDFIKFVESIVREGAFNDEIGSDFYLSTPDIESNNIYCVYDDMEVSYFWTYSIPPITIYDPDVCSLQKKWLESLKKYSVLISKSNEMLQTDFFNKQYGYVNILLSE